VVAANGRRPRVAIAHDYLTQRGGAEKVVLALARAFPEAPIYTTLYDPAGTYPEFEGLDIRTSSLNRFLLLRRNHRLALPVLAPAASRMMVDADVVIASSSGWAHGFRSSGPMVVYCYSPARWLYQPEAYLGLNASAALRAALRTFTPALKAWDRRAAARAREYIAISSVVQARIRDAYDRDSVVVPAPHTVDTDGERSAVAGLQHFIERGYLLCVSRLLPYKNVDKVVDAIRLRPEYRLVVVGNGPDRDRLAAHLPENARLVSDVTDSQLRGLYANADGLVAASYEDFGLTPIEAGAFGVPSATLRWGGFLDTVTEGISGVHFDAPEAAAIADALDRLYSTHWNERAIRERAAEFSEARFAESLHAIVDAQGRGR
jgi:glycosyltransferase involved in cell wall biosynthesis